MKKLLIPNITGTAFRSCCDRHFRAVWDGHMKLLGRLCPAIWDGFFELLGCFFGAAETVAFELLGTVIFELGDGLIRAVWGVHFRAARAPFRNGCDCHFRAIVMPFRSCLGRLFGAVWDKLIWALLDGRIEALHHEGHSISLSTSSRSKSRIYWGFMDSS